MTLGNNIKKIRKLRGLTQEELAGKISISRSYLGDVENDRKNLSYKTVENLAKKLDISMVYLNTGNDIYINLGYYDSVSKAMDEKLNELENKAKERYKEGATHADGFDLSIIDDAIEKLDDAVYYQKEIIRDNEKVEFKDAAFLNGLYKTIKEMNVDVFSEEDRQRLRGIILLLLSDASDIDIDDIHKQLKESEPKNKKE